MSKFLAVIIMVLTLTGCAWNKCKDIPPPNEYVVVDPEPVPELNLKEVDWQVWNQDKLAQEGSDSENTDKVFFVLTQEEANKLFSNLNQISDSFAKSISINKYWQDSVNEYRKKTAEKNKKDSTK